MTTADEALTDLARKINEEGWTCNGGIHEPGEYDSCIACQAVSNEVARVVLPIIRKAERDAVRGALDGFIAQEEASFLRLHVKGAVMSAEACSHARFAAEEYKHQHYPTPEDAP